MQEFQEALKLIKEYSDNWLIVSLVILWIVRRWLLLPFAKEVKAFFAKMDEWEKRVLHYLEIHDESLFTSGRIEKLLREIKHILARGVGVALVEEEKKKEKGVEE